MAGTMTDSISNPMIHAALSDMSGPVIAAMIDGALDTRWPMVLRV